MAGFWSWLVTGEPMTRSDVPPPSDPSTATIIPSRAVAARAVGAREAMSLSMVYRAIQIHATAVGSMSLDAYRGDDRLEPAPLFIRQPDMDDTRPAFLEQTTVSLAAQGNAYWRIYRDGQSRVNDLKVLNPLDVLPNTDSSGRITGYSYQSRDLKLNEVKHLKLLRVPGSVYGLGPIQAAQAELRGVMDTRDYASNWFQTSGVPSGVLKTEQHLDRERAIEAGQDWDATPAGKTRVLGNGLDYKAVFLSPADAQWLEARQFDTTSIARLFGVPASLMLATVEGNSQSYANVAQDWLAYFRFTLAKYTREIEMAFSTLLPRGSEARFNYEALLRSDTESRYKAHREAIAMGLYSAKYARQIEGIPETAAPKPAPAPAPAPSTEEDPDA